MATWRDPCFEIAGGMLRISATSVSFCETHVETLDYTCCDFAALLSLLCASRSATLLDSGGVFVRLNLRFSATQNCDLGRIMLRL